MTWNEYELSTLWTVAGGDYDPVTPAPVAYTEATEVGFHEIAGLKELVKDALASRGGIVSIIVRADDEAPLSTKLASWHDRLQATAARRWRLVIDYTPPDPGRRGGQRSRFGAGALAARPASPTSGAEPQRPRAAR